jgi:hypothetical protein
MSAGAPPAPARTTTCSSPTGSSPPSSTCGSSSRTRPWPSCTGSTGPRSPARFMRSGPCWPPAGSPSPGSPASGCGPWPICSPAPPPVASPSAWTAPKCRSDGPARASPAAAPSYRARKAEHQEGRCRHRRQGPHRVTGAFRPGRMHDQTAVRTEGIADLFEQFPPGQRQSRRRVPRPRQAVSRPGPGTAAETEARRHPGRNRRLRGTTPQAVIGTHLRRARERRTQAMAPPPAVPRTTRGLRRDLPGNRRASLTAPPSGNPQPTRQASTAHR